MPERAGLDKDKAQRFLQQVMKDVAASFHSAMSYIGDRLGIFKAIAAAGPVTVGELSHRTGLQERYLREWRRPSTPAIRAGSAPAAPCDAPARRP